MSLVTGFAPWIVYWILVGNIPFEPAALIALAVAAAALVVGRTRGLAGATFEVGAVVTFAALAIITLSVSETFMERWIHPLSNLGVFLVTLGGVLIGKPFVREFAEVDRPPEVTNSEPFLRITLILTWIWVAAFAGMTVSSAIPPIVQPGATIRDVSTPLSFVCYWVIPTVLMGLAMLANRVVPARLAPDPDSGR